jgi:hypothetical protein
MFQQEVTAFAGPGLDEPRRLELPDDSMVDADGA